MHQGAVMHARGEHSSAVEVLSATHAAQTQALGESHPDALESAWRLGTLLGTASTPATDGNSAVKLLRRTAELQTTQLGEAHPRTLRTLLSLGEALVAMAGGDGLGEALLAHAAEAAQLFHKAEAGMAALLEPEHPDLVKAKALAARHADALPDSSSD